MRDILLIDLDDTLLDFSKGEEESLKKVLNYYGIENSKENHQKYYDINIRYWKMYELHQIERERLLGLRFEDFFSLFGIKVNGKEVNDLYFSYLGNTAYLVKNCEKFLDECLNRKLTLIIVSNGVGRVQNPRINKSGLKKYFKKIYLSEEIGYNKPDIEFFESILKDFSEKERMIIIGDSLTSDIQGGINFNIPTIWYNPNHKKTSLSTYQVDDLLDIFKVLEEV